MHTVLQLFAYDEVDRLVQTLDAVADQSVPPDTTIEYEAWVTPTTSAPENDPTYRIAAAHDVFEARAAPRGKLSTRNVAHDDAFGRGADAVVVWDADVTPSDGALAALIDPLTEPGVVASNSSPRYYGSPFAPAISAVAVAKHAALPYMHGQASGFTTAGWAHAGPFDEDRDETALHAVWLEEERGFYRRLRDVGVVAHPGATVYEEDRRTRCTIERANHRFRGTGISDYCGRQGVETFMLHGCDTCGPDDRNTHYR